MADFVIRVVVDPNRAVTGAKRVRGELNAVEGAATRVRRALTGAFAILAGGAILTSGVRTLASFSQELSTVQAISRATGAEFARLEEQAISLGTNTRFTATQAAEGMTFLARAGFEANEIFETVDDTLNLAQAGALDLGTAADIASNALQAFRLDTDQAARVVDVLALAANTSNTNVQQLGDGLKLVAPIAAGVGVEIEETAAAMAALSNAGLQASLAGTGLRRVISELESPSAKTSKILGSLGLSSEDYRVSVIGLTGALDNLATAGVDTGQALEIFGDRGGPAFEVLSSSIDDVRRFTENLQGAEGTAERIARTMDDNLNGALLRVKSAFEGLILRLGQSGATGALRTFFEALATGLRSAADNIESFIKVVEALAFVLGVRLARQAIPAVTGAVNRLTASIAANPFGAVAVGATLAVGALIAFREEITLTENSTTTLGDVFTATFEVLGGIAAEVSREIVDVFNALNVVLGGVFEELELSVQGVLELAATVADRTLGLFQGLGNALIALFNGLAPAAADLFFVQINGLLAFYEFALDATRALFGTITRQSSAIATALLNFFREIASALFLLVTGAGDAALQTAKDATETFGGQVASVALNSVNVFKSEFAKLGDADTIPQLNNPFQNAATDLGSAVLNGFLDGLDVTLVRGVLDDIVVKADDARAAAESAAEATAEAAAAQAAASAGGGAGAQGGDTGLGFSADALQLLQQIQAPHQQFLATQAALNELLAAGAITAEEYAIALNEVTIATNTISSSVSEGLTAGLAQIENQIIDTSGAIQTTLVNAFSSAQDAFVEFVTTGEVNFSQFVDSILADVARLAFNQGIKALLGGGGEGGLLFDLFGSGKAAGGPVQAGKPVLVGEQGPELFTPPGAGNIVPAGETAAILSSSQQQAPVVNVAPPSISITNVSDPSEVPDGIESSAGEQAVMNVIRRNRRSVRSSL